MQFLHAVLLEHLRRRQWSLVDTDHMRYHQLNEWDRAMMELDSKTGFLSSSVQWVTHIDQEKQVRLVWGFCFVPLSPFMCFLDSLFVVSFCYKFSENKRAQAIRMC
jgi:hypothetical protein